MRYPKAPRSDQVDVLHGTKVPDPFRPLEQADSPETQAWIKSENELTEAFLAKSSERTKIRERLADIMNFPRETAPWRDGGRYLVGKNSGLENQNRLYWRATLRGEDHEFLDPNRLASDGTAALISGAVSPDGKNYAYQLSHRSEEHTSELQSH